MLEDLGHSEAASAVESAVVGCLKSGEVTVDLGGGLSTSDAGDRVVSRLG